MKEVTCGARRSIMQKEWKRKERASRCFKHLQAIYPFPSLSFWRFPRLFSFTFSLVPEMLLHPQASTRNFPLGILRSAWATPIQNGSKSCWTVRNPAAPVSHKENLPRIYLKWSRPRITGNIRKHTRTHTIAAEQGRGDWSEVSEDIWSNACRLQTAAWRNVGQKSQAAQNQLILNHFIFHKSR